MSAKSQERDSKEATRSQERDSKESAKRQQRYKETKDLVLRDRQEIGKRWAADGQGISF